MKELIDSVLKAEEELKTKAGITEEKVLAIKKQAEETIELKKKELADELEKEKNENLEKLDSEIKEYREKLQNELESEIKTRKEYLISRKKDIQSKIIGMILGQD